MVLKGRPGRSEVEDKTAHGATPKRRAAARLHWLQVIVHGGALLSLAWLAWQYLSGVFVIDPVKEITTYSGKAALVLLVLSLACTPIQTLVGWKAVGRVRRALGVYGAIYAGLHFLTYIGLDYRFDLGLLLAGLAEERYVLIGFAAGLILLALALTSTRGWQKRLRKNWKRLHRLAYLAGVLAVIHFLWLAKDDQEPLRYAGIVALLLAMRLPPVRRAAGRLRQRAQVVTKRLFDPLPIPKILNERKQNP